MKVLENILVPVPLRTESAAQRDTAVKLAKQFGSKIHLYHCIPKYDSKFRLPAKLLFKKMTGRLQEEREFYENLGLKAIVHEVEEGIAYEGILHKAEDLNANLILFGPAFGEGHNEVKVERVVKMAESPVWIANQSGFSAIACGIDYSAASKRAFTNTLHLAKAFGSKIIVINGEAPPENLQQDEEISEPLREEWLKNRESRMQSFLLEFDTKELEIVYAFPQDDPLQSIQEYLKKEEASLFLMGTTGKDSGSDVRIGSLSQSFLKAEHDVSLIFFSRRDVIRIATHQKLEYLNKLLEQGWQLLESEKTEESLEAFEKAIHMDSFSVHAWKGLAQARAKLGFVAEAAEAERRAKEIRQYYWDRRIEQEIRNRKGLL